MRTSYSKHSFRALATTFVLLSSASAFAQTPTTVDPGRLIDRFDRSTRTTPSRDVVIERQGKEVAPTKGDTKKIFTLSRVVVKGSTVYGEEGPKAAYAQWIGQQVSFADLQTIAQAMTAQYRNDGYILSRVVLSPQKIGGGVVTFQAIEGFVDQIELNGKIEGDRELLESYASHIRAERPLNSKTLERYLLLMDDLPGVTARGVLKASPTQKGASTLVVQLQDKEFEGSLQVDNRGNRFIGPYQLQAVGAVNSAFGMYDRNTLRLLSSSDFEELAYGDFTTEWQLGTEGTRFTTRIAAARTEPGSTLAPLGLEGETNVLDIGVLHPYLRSRGENLFFRGEFRAQNSRNDSLGVELFNDQVRHLAAGADYDIADSWDGVNKISGTVTQGLDILGATDDGAGRSRIDGEHTFTKFNANATRIQDITDAISLYGSVHGQVAADPLLTSEQFGVGGESIGRAYDGAEILGDHGVSAILELRFRGMPEDQSIVNSYEPYVFYDGGAVWLKNPAVGEQKRSSLVSTGLGTRFNLVNDLSGYVEVSFPLTREVASELDNDPRFFFNVSKRF